jgi:hypothetical protein
MVFEKAYDSICREVIYSIIFEFGIAWALVELIEMSLHETYSTVRIGKVCLTSSVFRMAATGRCFITITFQLSFAICH